ncbi:alpha/beta fold hydrolase [Amycolatopsis sp. NPDC058986]|uniref:alpha/beta fold hydrolase n=1 Tax=unclassified Amycolatopsis TaxID=2618356 RepID=UPI00366F8182
MATFVLIHGGGSSGWDWHLVAAELRRRGHDVVAPDLPIEDRSAGLIDFTNAVLAALGDRVDPVVVGHSYGGITAPLVCSKVSARLLVFVAGMVPAPGEKPGDWWGNTGFVGPEGLSQAETYFGDVPEPLVAECLAHGRSQVSAEGNEPWPLEALPDVPAKALLCRDDRFFPPEFLRRVTRERLGVEPDEIDGSHMVLLSRPKELVDRLESYLAS